MAYRTPWPNTVFSVCVSSSPKEQSKSTQRSINWPHLEEGIRSANLPAIELELHLTLRKELVGARNVLFFTFAGQP
jgi:hypothetical protein